MNFSGCPSPRSWMISGHSSCDIHNGSGLTARAWVTRTPSRISRTKRREQLKALAISRMLRPSASRRLISSCLCTVNSLRAIQLSRAKKCTTIADCCVSRTEALRLSLIAEQSTAVEGAGATIGRRVDSGATPENALPLDIAVPLLKPRRRAKTRAIGLEKRLRPAVPFRGNWVGPVDVPQIVNWADERPTGKQEVA